MNKQEKKRLVLFKKYSKNLKLISKSLKADLKIERNRQIIEIPEEVYICPICFDAFLVNGIYENDSNFLTLEDVPPKKLGGKPTLLTCKNCNNKSGKILDSQLKMSLEAEQVFKGKTNIPIKARFQFGESNIGGTFEYFNSKNYEMKIREKSNPNAKTDIQYFFDNWGKEKMNVTFNVPNENYVRIGLLRIAYLKMFL